MQVTSRKVAANGKASVLLEMLAKLPQKEQLKIHDQLEQWLQTPPLRRALLESEQPTNSEFFQTELGRYILAEAKGEIPVAKVRQGLSTITGSLAQAINDDREER